MFSYRHAFHAGNHADVLKHTILVHVLDYFNRKDAPYWVIDTHAGAGIYDLRSEWATKRGEFADGLDRLLAAQAMPDAIERYLQAVQHFNPDGVANFYPGSPWLALQAMRGRDRLRLFEMHPTEIEVLRDNLKREAAGTQRQVAVYQADGFNGLKSQLPPAPRRGIVLIDPSYEDKRDYRHTVQALSEGLKRFATGCFIVWYPLVQRREVADLQRALTRLATPWLHATLSVSKPAATGLGLHGSGMFVVNPPWTLHDALATTLPWLKATLAQDDRANFTLARHGD
ncbi:23S rRNA (adenine(2030)-N(6))-methyltransferase RlmJ [Allopusillimonas soli]|uniref:Ribosomal RNA large subunit methyltransferase J n=1 Tax=Allopusillimonas soli TaxID=659016 RepID=A0A853FA11_9BURK|nr:23S rRNA (adenine(2030)-N(6))-methyltransferase RlmJ [Allopusillimonas soli]NYT36618.1 23S rRNA (adenine(2030)-N(6))-methyltransferase RlmJ [Allopusillimonas soli]TEA75106.1 23S rRNA (adenine(2030)-N(6))-methyltransferase RlmJ [Allopusillimonas soli]